MSNKNQNSKMIEPRRSGSHIYTEVWKGIIGGQDLDRSTELLEAMLHEDGINEAYVLIIDISELASLPNLRSLTNATKKHNKALCHIICVGKNSFFTTVARGIKSLTGYDIQVADEMQAAIEMAKEILQLVNKS